jgi:L-ribulokinase
MGPKNHLLRGIEVKFAGRKASAVGRAEGGYTSIEFDVARHQKSAEGSWACGGLPAKNKLLMQIFADVMGREIMVAKRPQTCSALGAAIHAAAAAGRQAGGYKTIPEAAEHMAHLQSGTYRPRPQNHEIYNRLFKEFQTLHDYFGRGENDVMKRLKTLRREQAAR